MAARRSAGSGAERDTDELYSTPRGGNSSAREQRAGTAHALFAVHVSDSPRPVIVTIPWRTVATVLTAVALVWLWLKLVEMFLVLLVAVLLAVTLNPVVGWFEG